MLLYGMVYGDWYHTVSLRCLLRVLTSTRSSHALFSHAQSVSWNFGKILQNSTRRFARDSDHKQDSYHGANDATQRPGKSSFQKSE